MKAECAFNARSVSTFGLDRLYRVYLRQGELFFIKIGGQGGAGAAVAMQFGLLGALAQSWLSERSARSLKQKLDQFDRLDPRSLLGRDKNNFRLVPAEVVESSLEPAAKLQMHGAHVGIWKLHLRNRTTYTLQFEEKGEMDRALAVLPTLLGKLLVVRV
jgi:hypothetical protein